MEADIESNEEMEEQREGFASVKLSKYVKYCIRAVWASSLIVRVYGRSIGFNYIQTKLNALWKPTGRMDVIILGKEFFLTRFSCKEDHDVVLKKGPWFIGEQFLSIKPWEPNFKPSMTNVSSIVVWIRLNELPIEYYKVEVLKQIGNSVGKVLRINTHTAAKARDRFARLCVQVDIDKPLVTNIDTVFHVAGLVTGGKHVHTCFGVLPSRIRIMMTVRMSLSATHTKGMIWWTRSKVRPLGLLSKRTHMDRGWWSPKNDKEIEVQGISLKVVGLVTSE